jgi:glyoxylase-like metal-dependent hydrolase (beta-lactamase superfamily II)
MGPILPDKVANVLLVSIETALWGENCWVLAAGPGCPALVIDPGLGATEAVTQLCAEQDLTVAAVLASHGHIDHVADAAPLADRWQVPVLIHHQDRELLSNPAAGLNLQAQADTARVIGDGLVEPKQVREIAGGDQLDLAGFSITVLHAPGHRPGCVIYRLPTVERRLAFTGDVLFANSIGRTDLPGGSMTDMVTTLRQVVLGTDADGEPNLPDDTVILPGHGAHSTMAEERAHNPYLQTDFWENAT